MKTFGKKLFLFLIMFSPFVISGYTISQGIQIISIFKILVSISSFCLGWVVIYKVLHNRDKKYMKELRELSYKGKRV